jgi:hypothetical protein
MGDIIGQNGDNAVAIRRYPIDIADRIPFKVYHQAIGIGHLDDPSGRIISMAGGVCDAVDGFGCGDDTSGRVVSIGIVTR